MSSRNDDALPEFSQMLRSSLAGLLDPTHISFVEMLREDAIMEFPFAPDGLPRKLAGRAAVREHLENLRGRLQFKGFTVPVVHTTGSGVMVLEFSGSAVALPSNRPYEQDYVSVITLQDGQIAHYRDYWNPLAVLRAMNPAEGTSPEEAG